MAQGFKFGKAAGGFAAGGAGMFSLNVSSVCSNQK